MSPISSNSQKICANVQIIPNKNLTKLAFLLISQIPLVNSESPDSFQLEDAIFAAITFPFVALGIAIIVQEIFY